MLRGMLGVLSGFILANSLPTYGGVGVNLLLFAVDRHTPEQNVFLYSVFGVFALVMTVLLSCLAFLLLAEFIQKKFHFTQILHVVIVPSVLTFSLLHIAVSLGLVKIQDIEFRDLLIDSSLPYPVLTLASLALFVLVHRMTPRKPA